VKQHDTNGSMFLPYARLIRIYKRRPMKFTDWFSVVPMVQNGWTYAFAVTLLMGWLLYVAINKR
jgi:hypothetical protein